jgi:ribosomal 30S subunit maturation factor RimM
MKKFMASLACLTLVGAAAAIAESPATNLGGKSSYSVDEIEGKDILDAAGKQIGDVDDIVQNSSNQRMAVVGLEDSTKEVAIPLDKISLSADGKNLTTSMTRSELESLPDYDPMDMKSVED